jgi:hypothetical protein
VLRQDIEALRSEVEALRGQLARVMAALEPPR